MWMTNRQNHGQLDLTLSRADRCVIIAAFTFSSSIVVGMRTRTLVGIRNGGPRRREVTSAMILKN
jgi:hypothetical protein